MFFCLQVLKLKRLQYYYDTADTHYKFDFPFYFEKLHPERATLQATLERERVELKENYARELNSIQEKFSKAEGLVSTFNEEEEKYVRQINAVLNFQKCYRQNVFL